MCGENSSRRCIGFSGVGSSPRVRGKRQALSAAQLRRGLIPACAGKTDTVGMKAEIMGAHPRVCGENRSVASRASAERGSSPRVRGKQLHGLLGGSSSGLIPACAGKTSRAAATWTSRPAHPRVCGENRVGLALAGARLGSSPRVRGKPFLFNVAVSLRGLIPACAGKTPKPQVARGLDSAHPRVCGENRLLGRLSRASKGSSPRVRGKH